MDKLTFPKGSLKFKKLGDKKAQSLNTKELLMTYERRKKYNKLVRKEYGKDLIGIAPEAILSSAAVETEMRKARKILKDMPSSSAVSSYEIKFKHPKWFALVGEIVLTTDKKTVKDSLKQIAIEFKKRKDDIRKFRTFEKVTRIASVNTDLKYNKSGGIPYMPHLTQGIYIKFLKDQEKKIVFSQKVPKDNINQVGIELEFMCDWDREKLGFALYDIGVGKQVCLKTDGSIRCHHNNRHSDCNSCANKNFAHELCIMTKESEYKEVMKKICEVLSKSNATVNKSCGMHVHIDMRNRDSDKSYQNLVSAQGVFFKMNPKSRLEEYAKRSQERDFEIAKGTGDRYRGINATAYNKHKTIEIRIHSGTIDYIKVTNWIELLLSVVNCEKKHVKNFISLKSFCETFSIPEALREYIKERIEKFKIKDETLPIPEAESGAA